MKLILSLVAIAVAFSSTAARSAAGSWTPAVVEHVTATPDANGFTITANIQLPQPKACYSVKITRELVTVPPYRYLVLQEHNGQICTEQITPYVATQHFSATTQPKTVDVYALDANHKPHHSVVPVTR